MGRLINPGIGELLDRLSILELKIDRYKGDTASYKDEAYAIRKRLPKQDRIWGPVHKELIEVNTKLWEAEDQLRGLRLSPTLEMAWLSEAATVGTSIQDLNDKRNSIIQAANAAMGDGYKEKGD